MYFRFLSGRLVLSQEHPQRSEILHYNFIKRGKTAGLDQFAQILLMFVLHHYSKTAVKTTGDLQDPNNPGHIIVYDPVTPPDYNLAKQVNLSNALLSAILSFKAW